MYTTQRHMWGSNPGPLHLESDALPPGHHAPHIQNLLLLILSSDVAIQPIPEKEVSMALWLRCSHCKPGVTGSIPGFSSLSDETINGGPVSIIRPKLLVGS